MSPTRGKDKYNTSSFNILLLCNNTQKTRTQNRQKNLIRNSQYLSAFHLQKNITRDSTIPERVLQEKKYNTKSHNTRARKPKIVSNKREKNSKESKVSIIQHKMKRKAGKYKTQDTRARSTRGKIARNLYNTKNTT